MTRLTSEAVRVVRQLEPGGHVDIADLGLVATREVEHQAVADVPHEPAVADVRDHVVPGPESDIPVRVYRPDETDLSEAGSEVGSVAGASLAGTIVFLHGGGWVMGNIDLADTLCRGIARTAGAAVVSVDYRLAPEDPYPAAIDDSFAATCWVAENARTIGVDGSRLAVCGSSAGGNLAAAVALAARDRGGPRLRAQALLCPALEPRFDTGSYVENSQGYPLSTRDMRFFWGAYLGSSAVDSLAAPLLATDLDGLPPAGVVAAECDVLRDEGLAYAERLGRSGVPVETWDHAGMFHGFYGFVDQLEDARRCVRNVATFLRGRLIDPVNQAIDRPVAQTVAGGGRPHAGDR